MRGRGGEGRGGEGYDKTDGGVCSSEGESDRKGEGGWQLHTWMGRLCF